MKKPARQLRTFDEVDTEPAHAVSNEPRTAIAYMRQSTKKEESISQAVQWRTIRTYCTRENIKIVDKYWEQVSGRKWSTRSEVVEATDRVIAGEAQCIIVMRWDRFSRDGFDWREANSRIESVGGRVISATEVVDLETAAGRLSRDIGIDVAAYYSRLIGESWQATQRERRDAGKTHSGGRRYGYRRIVEKHENGRTIKDWYEIEPAEAEILKWMYQAYIDGWGWAAIATKLNADNVPTAGQGVEWRNTAVQQMLDRGFGAGWCRSRHGDYIGTHAAIISQDMWDDYVAARRLRKGEAPRVSQAAYSLTGLCKCAGPDCGAPMHRRVLRPGKKVGVAPWVGRECARRLHSGMRGGHAYVSERRVLAAVKEKLAEMADEINRATDEIGRTERRRDEAQAASAAAARRVDSIQAALRRLNREWVTSSMTVGERDDLAAELRRDLVAAQDAHAAATQVTRAVGGKAGAAAADLLHEWDSLPGDALNRMLRRLIDRIEVTPAGRLGGRCGIDVVPRG